jgi:RNA exonuclease 4
LRSTLTHDLRSFSFALSFLFSPTTPQPSSPRSEFCVVAMVRGNKFKPQAPVVAKAAAAVAEVEKEVEATEVAPANKDLPKAVLVPVQQQQQKKKKPPAPAPPPPPKKHSLPTIVAAPPTPAAAGANWAAMRAAKLVGSGGGAIDKRKRGDERGAGGGAAGAGANGTASKRHKATSILPPSTAAARADFDPLSPHRPEAIDGAATRALTRVLAVDCEMVGVGPGGVRSSLARVCLVNESGAVVLDTHVAQREKVTDHRTRVSGIRPEHLDSAPDAAEVRRRVGELIEGRVLVGHAVSHDLTALMLGHPRAMLRDTARYPPLMRSPGAPGRKPKARKLRDLARQHLGLVIQEGEHSPVDDARAALYLYQLHRKTWEAALKRPGGMRELRPPMNDRKKQKKGGNGSGGAQAALAKLAEEDEMVDL